MTGRDRCPRCGSDQFARVPGDPCPRCLLGGLLGVEGPTPAHTTTGVLRVLGATSGPMPRVLLRDADTTGPPGPMVRPHSAEMPGLPDRAGRLQLLGEIARGGMGAVLKGRDVDLGRDLAVKVLLERHGDDPDLVRRFVEEAQIAGQLQHPGIVPIYELGAFDDRRPYFAMKLVKGTTLAEVLADRGATDADRPRLLSVFLDIAQTMAYAHARGVIHRDLKPSNVMVGSFGEVQVMDWGLAKVLPRGGAVDDHPAGKVPAHETVIATARSAEGHDLSVAGSVMGTPSYMAPEQARGEGLDERADVFSLGSILAEILTGRPAFGGRTSGEIQRKAARGDTSEARALLGSCQADPELLSLALDCLAAEPDDRPADANVVAGRLSAHLAGVQARVRAAERDRAVAQAQAIEERRRRKLQAGLAASILALAAVGGLATAHHLRQARALSASVDRALGESTALIDRARLRPDDAASWRAALDAARRVEGSPGVTPEVAARVARAKAEAAAGLDAAERDALLLRALLAARANSVDVGHAETDVAYASAFRAAGLDLEALDAAEAAARIRRRTPEIVVELAAYLDHWSSRRRAAGRASRDWRKPLEVARSADTDPYRDRARALLIESDSGLRATELRALADDPRAVELPPATLIALAGVLAGPAEVVALLRKAATRHPDDVWINLGLAESLERLRPPSTDEAIRYYTAARALRPETAHQLAHVLERAGRIDEARATFGDLVARRPSPLDLGCYYGLLRRRGTPAEARTVLDRYVRACREAVDREPGRADHRRRLALAFQQAGDRDAARDTAREAVRLRPDLAEGHFTLARILDTEGRPDEAIAAYREAIRLQLDHVEARSWLASALANRGEIDGSVAEYREAIRLRPGDAANHPFLASQLVRKGEHEAAIATYREAIRLDPDQALSHFGLAVYLAGRRRDDEAIAEFREAIRSQPDLKVAHDALGQLLEARGDFAGAVAALRRGLELEAGRPGGTRPPDDRLRQAERKLALSERLGGILDGSDRPADPAESMAFAAICRTLGRHAAASRLFADAVAIDPTLADDLGAAHRYDAACSAALAADGRSQDDPPPDDAGRAGLRDRARAWLGADLAARSRAIGGGTRGAREEGRKALAHWKGDPDLDGVRDPAGLAKLPEAERESWKAFWAEVDRALGQGETPTPGP